MRIIEKLLKVAGLLVVLFVVGFSVFWFSLPVDVSFAEHKQSIPHSQYSKFAEVNGVRLHYQEKGAGVPLVLIHGYGASTYSWRDVFDPLSEKFRVVAVDLKGFGFSAKPDGDYSRREQSALVDGLLDHLNIDKAWLVGSSMGGEVSLNLALRNANRVEGLILIDSAGVKSVKSGSITPSQFEIPFLGRAFAALALVSDRLVRENLEKSFFDDSKVTDEIVGMYHIPLQTNYGQRAALRAKGQWDLYPIENELSKISVPTLLLWGAEDVVTPIEGGKKMNALIKNSEFVVFEKCGHLPQEEMPEETIAEILKFTGKREKSDETQ